MPLPTRKVALKDSTLKSLKPAPKGKRTTVWDALMPNMAVRVTDKGRRSFYAVKRRAGEPQPTWHLLGQYPHMSLGEAREAAREAILTLDMGQSPKTIAEERRAAAVKAAREAASSTFEAIAEKFASSQLPNMRPSSRRKYEAYLRRQLVPALGATPITEIRRRDVLALVREIKDRSGKASAAGALAVLRQCLNWALDEDIEGFDTNPASAVSAKKVIGESVDRSRLLTDPELRAVWTATDSVGQPFTTIYRLLLLTGLRLNEVAGARWDDLDLDAGVLTIPEERAKNGEAMLVPLPPLAVELFAATPRFSGPFIFTTTAGRRPIASFSHAKARLDEALGDSVEPFVVHDYRRVVRSGLGRLSVPTTVAELCLGHTRKGIEGVYDRHSYFGEKREALQRWQQHLLSIVEPPEPDDEAADDGKVVPMPARARR